MIQREISRVLVLNLSGKKNGAYAPPRTTMSLTEPSLLSRATRGFAVGRNAGTEECGDRRDVSALPEGGAKAAGEGARATQPEKDLLLGIPDVQEILVSGRSHLSFLFSSRAAQG
jgi:hypothetical protein